MKTKNFAMISFVIMSLFTASCMSSHDTMMVQPTDLAVTSVEKPSATAQSSDSHSPYSVKPVIEM